MIRFNFILLKILLDFYDFSKLIHCYIFSSLFNLAIFFKKLSSFSQKSFSNKLTFLFLCLIGRAIVNLRIPLQKILPRNQRNENEKNPPFRFAVYFRSKINNSDFRREFFIFKLAFEFYFFDFSKSCEIRINAVLIRFRLINQYEENYFLAFQLREEKRNLKVKYKFNPRVESDQFVVRLKLVKNGCA